MTYVERIHTGDIVIAVVLVATQIQILHLLFTDGKSRLSPRTFGAALAVLGFVWLCAGAGLLLNLIYMGRSVHWLPPVVRSFFSSTEIVTAFISAFTIAVYLACRALIRLPSTRRIPGRRRLIQSAAAAGMAAPIALCGFGAFIERTRYRVTEVDLPMRNLHPDLDGLRVVQISDLHVSPFLSVREAGRVVDIANELRPQLALVTGDLISDVGDPLDATIAELARLRAEGGILGCLGNHELYAECEVRATAEAARRGIKFLRHELRSLRWGNGVLNVAGVDFQPFRRKDWYLYDADKLVVQGGSNLLLSHNPDVFPVAVRQGFDAVVSGHTHGGQVTVEILRQTLNFARFFTPYVAGLYRLNGRSCYVSAGIGTIGMPVRLGAPPEITLLRLRREEPA